MELKVTTSQNTYSVIIERGILNHVAEYIDTKRRVYIVSDDGVPEAYQDILLSQFIDVSIYIFQLVERVVIFCRLIPQDSLIPVTFCKTFRGCLGSSVVLRSSCLGDSVALSRACGTSTSSQTAYDHCPCH